MTGRGEYWHLRRARTTSRQIESYARRVAELFLWAPAEHEARIDGMLNTACDLIGIDPSVVLEDVRKNRPAVGEPNGQDV